VKEGKHFVFPDCAENSPSQQFRVAIGIANEVPSGGILLDLAQQIAAAKLKWFGEVHNPSEDMANWRDTPRTVYSPVPIWDLWPVVSFSPPS
jgi:hypothetical protein